GTTTAIGTPARFPTIPTERNAVARELRLDRRRAQSGANSRRASNGTPGRARVAGAQRIAADRGAARLGHSAQPGCRAPAERAAAGEEGVMLIVAHRTRCVAAGICTAVWMAMAVAAAAEPAPAQKSIVSDVGIDQNLGAQVDMDLKFVDEQGRPVALKDLAPHKPIVLTLVYYRCPMLCNQVLNELLKSSQAVPFQMGKDYHVISVSIDPKETPDMAAAKKEQYVKRYRRPGADEGWHFLTGRQPEIQSLARTV